MRVDRVLAAVADPSEDNQPVIERAVRLAARFDADLVLFHAAFDSSLSGRPFFDSKRLARSRGYYVARRQRELERLASAATKKQQVATSTHVVWEEPADQAILRATLREGADLVVAGPHAGERTNLPFSFRQTDWQLMRLCPRPLWMVRTARRRRGPVVVALDPTHMNDKPAQLDALLLRAALAVARAEGVDLYAVHSVPPSAYPPASTAASQARLRERIRRKMQRLLKPTGLPSSQIRVLRGRPEDTIPEIARELEAQVVVMGALSRRGLKRFAMGNTAERIIDSVPCDLLIIKPEQFELKLERSVREPVILPQE